MAQENVQLVYEGYGAVARGDLEAMLSLIDPSIEVRDIAESLFFQDEEAGALHGHEGLLYLLENLADVFEDFRIEVEEVIDGGEKVLACLRISGRGKDSGANVDMRLVHVWTHVDQKAVRLDVYKDKAEALEALGLSEQDAHADS